MNLPSLLGIISGVFLIGGYIPYIYEVLKGTTTPNRASWFIWALSTAIILFGVKETGTHEAIWVPIADALGCTVIFLFSLFWGVGGWSRTDKISLVICMASVGVFFVTGNAFISLVMNLLIYVSRYIPTIQKAYQDPKSESFAILIYMKNYCIYGGALLLGVGIFLPLSSAHAAQCTFTRTLELETVGEDVQCLQQFLNEQGFTIAESGVGSKGRETNQYKEKTKEAVKKWQKAVGIAPVTGNFGPLSKSKYEAGFVTAPSSTPTPAPVTTPSTVTQTTTTVSTSESSSKKQLIKALELADSFDEYIDDRDDGGKNLDDKKKVLTKVEGYALDATRAYLSAQYTKVTEFTMKITDALDKYSDDLEATDDKDGAKEALKEAKDTLDSVDEKIKKAKDRKKDTEDAEDEFDLAEDHYKNARDAYSDEDYEDVFDFLDDFDDSIRDALDAL